MLDEGTGPTGGDKGGRVTSRVTAKSRHASPESWNRASREVKLGTLPPRGHPGNLSKCLYPFINRHVTANSHAPRSQQADNKLSDFLFIILD